MLWSHDLLWSQDGDVFKGLVGLDLVLVLLRSFLLLFR